MEIVFQEKKNGERQLELWKGKERVCVCTEVTNENVIIDMVACIGAVGLIDLAINGDYEMKRKLVDKNIKHF